MDVLNKQLARVQEQLSGLTASQKMLTGALVAIMVMTLLYWGRHAGTAEMEPVLDQALSTEEMGEVQARLKAMGIKYSTSGDRLLVPADRKMEVLADLAFAGALPENVATGFDQMVAKLSAWASASERGAVYNRAKEITCSQVIGKFPGVSGATVMIDPTRERHIGAADVEPSATVTITMRDTGTAKKVAQAAVAVVTGAEAGLPARRVSVVINGQPQRVHTPGENGFAQGDEHLELVQQHEQSKVRTIMAMLDYVQGVRVAVSVRLSSSTVRTEEQEVDPTKFASKVRRSETEENETREDRPAATEPGVTPNVRFNAPMVAGEGAAGGGGSTTVQNRENIEYDNIPSYKRTHTETGPGEPTVVSASVRVPSSYIIGVLRQYDPAKTPTRQEVELEAERREKEMEDAVRMSAGMDKDAPVSVALFDDVIQLPTSVPQTATTPLPLMIGSHSKEIALGGLALVSLFMVSMMVKKSAPAPALLAAAPASLGASVAQLVAGEPLAGEAGDGNTMLAGMELDDESVRTQQMLDQVSTLVTDNPDAAASLVKRWLNRD